MILRLMFLSHWAVLLLFGALTLFLGIYIVEGDHFFLKSYGRFFWLNIEAWALYLGPLVVFYLIDYIINGKITWLPWERDK